MALPRRLLSLPVRPSPLTTLSPRTRAPVLVRTLASTPDSSHVSERHVSAAHGITPQDSHGAHGHEDHYDPPTGWLWGVPPGEQYKKEGWEGVWYWGFYGSLGLAVLAYAGKPDTR